ncbi:MAG: queuosine salvage family protein [Candidatus Buchananbacteria bacterium]
MLSVLESIQPVIKNSKFVSINELAMRDFCNQVTEADFANLGFALELQPGEGLSQGQQIAYIFVISAINFCYWSEPKWTIEDQGKFYDGFFGLLKATKRAIKDGFNLLDANYLKNLTKEDLAEILKGNVEIPLFDERLEILKKLGEIIIEKYNGSFSEVIIKSDGDALKLLEILASDFPEIFNDVANYHGQEVKLFKRAQILIAHLFDLKENKIIDIDLTGYDDLTACAEYKVPQSLRKFKILEYSNELADKIDNKIEIIQGSDEEIEIRANTIWAVELATRILKEKFPEINATMVDHIFWFKGQKKSPDDKPYHRTKTIWY